MGLLCFREKEKQKRERQDLSCLKYGEELASILPIGGSIQYGQFGIGVTHK